MKHQVKGSSRQASADGSDDTDEITNVGAVDVVVGFVDEDIA